MNDAGGTSTSNNVLGVPSAGATLPPRAGKAGYYLQTDGVQLLWATQPAGALPSQSASTNGKYIVSDGTTATWVNPPHWHTPGAGLVWGIEHR